MNSGDDDTTIVQLQLWIEEFCADRGWDPFHNPKDLAIGLVTEASELLEIFRFENDLETLMNNPSDRERMADELADSLYFILRFSQMYGFDLTKALREKLVKNALKYPVPSHQK